MALRTPISRVRSLTDMVMVLITESPPTISEMMATPYRMAFRISVELAICSWKALGPMASTPSIDSSISAASASGSVPSVGKTTKEVTRSLASIWLRTISGRSPTNRRWASESVIHTEVSGAVSVLSRMPTTANRSPRTVTVPPTSAPNVSTRSDPTTTEPTSSAVSSRPWA